MVGGQHALREFVRPLGAAQGLVDALEREQAGREVVPGQREIRVIGGQQPLAHRERLLERGQGLGGASETVQATAEACESRGDVGMVFGEEPSSHRQGLLEAQERLVRSTERAQAARAGGQAAGHDRVVPREETPFADGRALRLVEHPWDFCPFVWNGDWSAGALVRASRTEILNVGSGAGVDFPWFAVSRQ